MTGKNNVRRLYSITTKASSYYKKVTQGIEIGTEFDGQSERFALEEFKTRLSNTLTLALHAQAHLQRFYGRLGYSPKGDPFDEDGIPHILMLEDAL